MARPSSARCPAGVHQLGDAGLRQRLVVAQGSTTESDENGSV